MGMFMSHKIILAVTAGLSLTTCTSGTTTHINNDKEINETETTQLSPLNGDVTEYLCRDGSAPFYYAETKKVIYQMIKPFIIKVSL